MVKKLIIIFSLIGFCIPVLPMWQAWDSTKKFVKKHPYVAYTIGAVGLAGLTYALYACKNSTPAEANVVVVIRPSTYEEKLKYALSSPETDSASAACELLKDKHIDFSTSRRIESLSCWTFMKWAVMWAPIDVLQDICNCYYRREETLEHTLVDFAIRRKDVAAVTAVLDRNCNFDTAHKKMIYRCATNYGGMVSFGENEYNNDIVRIMLERELYSEDDVVYMREVAEQCLNHELQQLMQIHIAKIDRKKRSRETLGWFCMSGKFAHITFRFR